MELQGSLVATGTAAPVAGVVRTGLVVAEGMALLRDGLVGLLSGWPDGPVRAAGTMVGVEGLLAVDAGAVLLLDMDLPGLGGVAGLERLRGRFAGLRIVALSGRESRDGVLACLAAGAHGMVAKTAPFAELARAIAAVRVGGVHVPAVLGSGGGVGAPCAEMALEGLTGRQRDVLRLLAQGRSTKDIARTLDLAVSTIKVHLAAVYRVFGARNRVEALCRAGWVAPAFAGGDGS